MFNSEGPIFMGSNRNPNNSKVGIFGVPYDGTTSFRPGTRFGPNAIRDVSNGLETYCPELNLDLEDFCYADIGNLDISIESTEKVIKKTNQATKKLINMSLKPLLLGGEHSITSGAISAIAKTYPELIMIQLDAHADLRHEWQGTPHSHACAMRRCLEVLPSKQLLQVGIRSGTRAEFDELHTSHRLIKYTSGEKASGLSKALEVHKAKPIYLTVDLDWFDPSVMPGTGTPEPGGYTWKDFASILEVLREHNLISADIVELSPQLDPSGISSIFAAKVARSLIMLLSL